MPEAKSSRAPLRVAVLMGGPSAEAEVSRSSAAEVARALETAGFIAKCIELDHQVTVALQAFDADAAFPALHGPIGEDGTIQGYLEVLGLPYVGSDVRGSAVAMDKCIAKSVFRSGALPVAPEVLIDYQASPAEITSRICETLGERVVIKPRAEGSAIGVMRLTSRSDIRSALETAVTWPRGALAEPYISGMEVTVGVLDLHGQAPQATPSIAVETAQDEWYDFENRYAAGKSKHLIPAPVPEQLREDLMDIALRAHALLGLRDLSRSDFLVTDDHQITLLETNTLPGMTPTSLFPDGAAAAGLDFPALVSALVHSALSRAEVQNQ